MEGNKSQLVSELLALKTGLSILSDEADKVREAEAAWQSATAAFDAEKQAIEYEKANLQREQQRIKSHDAAVHDQEEQEQAAENKKRMRNLTFIISGILGFILIFRGAMILWQPEGGGVPLVVLGSLLLAVAIAGPVISAAIAVSNPQLPQSTVTAASVEEEKKVLAGNIKKWQLRKENLAAFENKVTDTKMAYDEILSVSQPYAQAVYAALKENYDATLRERDWQYVDLVIHYLDSDRADTKKEALRMVDEKMNTQELIHAIRAATDEMSASIRSVSDLVQYQLDSHYETLSRQIGKQYDKIASQMGSMQAEVAGVQREVSSRLDAAQKTSHMQTALIGKIKTDSTQLTKDMDYLLHLNR